MIYRYKCYFFDKNKEFFRDLCWIGRRLNDVFAHLKRMCRGIYMRFNRYKTLLIA